MEYGEKHFYYEENNLIENTILTRRKARMKWKKQILKD